MAKSPDAFRTISEVAEWLGVEAHVLRFWETKFSQVKPVKRAGGRRYYRPSDMALLGGIRRLLHDDGMTIRGVQKVLRERGIGHVSGLSPELRLNEAEAPVPSNARRAPEGTASGDDATPRRPAARKPAAVAGPHEGEDAPTLPFDLPPEPEPVAAAPGPGPAHDGDGRLHPAAPPQAPPSGDAAAAPLRVRPRAKQLDQAAASEVLARARALVKRLRNTPE